MTYATPTTVHDAAAPAAGYSAVHVFLDSLEVPATGDVLVAGEHALIAYALAPASLTAPDPGIVQRLTGLLSSSTPVADYQSLIYAIGALSTQVGDSAARAIVRASEQSAYAWPRDSAAYFRVEAQLAGNIFSVDSLPTPVPGPAPTNGSRLPYGFPFPNASLSPAPLGRANAQRGVIGRSNVTVPAGPVNPRFTRILHVNGVNTTRSEWSLNVATLRTAIREYSLFRDPLRTTVAGIYKPNEPTLLSRAHSPETGCLADLYPSIASLLASWVVPRCDSASLGTFMRGGGNALLQAASQLEDIITNSTPILFPTTDSIIKQELAARSGANHVSMVPHSQGNLFTIQAMQTLDQQGRAPADSDAACFGVVPLASPTSAGYPTNTWRISPVQIAGDAILALAGPKFPATSTVLGDSLNAQIPLAGGVQGAAAVRTQQIANALTLHAFESAYLSASGARALVKQAVKDIYSQCEVSLRLSSPSAPLDVGVTYPFSLQISGADGRSIDGASMTRWVSSDTSVVTVDSAGVARAVGSGEAIVTATFRGKTAAQVIAVNGPGLDPSFIIAPPTISTSDATDPFFRRCFFHLAQAARHRADPADRFFNVSDRSRALRD